MGWGSALQQPGGKEDLHSLPSHWVGLELQCVHSGSDNRAEKAYISLALGQSGALPKPAGMDGIEGTGETIATLRCGGNTPLNEGPSEFVFSEGRMQGGLCFLPAANHACRALGGASRSALGPAANLINAF